MASNATATPSFPPGYLEANDSANVRGSAIAAMVICILFYSLRIISRLLSKSGLIASDYFLFGGVIACFTISAIDIHVIELGLGRHVEAVAIDNPSLSNVKTMLKYLMVDNCVYAFGQITVKISLCLLYRYLFPSKTLHRIIDGIIIFTILWGIAFIGVSIGSCRPIYAFWEFELQALPSTFCIDTRKWYLSMAVPNIITDIAILTMPIRQVWKLQLNRNAKAALILIFLCGSFVCVASIVRVWALFAIDATDPTWTLTGIANWSSLEFAFAVMSASLPTLRPLVSKISPIFGAATNNRETAADSHWTGHSRGTENRKPRAFGGRGQDDFSMLQSSTDTYAKLDDSEGYEMINAYPGSGIRATTTITTDHHGT